MQLLILYRKEPFMKKMFGSEAFLDGRGQRNDPFAPSSGLLMIGCPGAVGSLRTPYWHGTLLFINYPCSSFTDRLLVVIPLTFLCRSLVLMADEVYQENIYQSKTPFTSCKKVGRSVCLSIGLPTS